MDARSVWSYHDTLSTHDADVVGYDVEALDGEIGKVSTASRETDDAHLVVDTGILDLR